MHFKYRVSLEVYDDSSLQIHFHDRCGIFMILYSNPIAVNYSNNHYLLCIHYKSLVFVYLLLVYLLLVIYILGWTVNLSLFFSYLLHQLFSPVQLSMSNFYKGMLCCLLFLLCLLVNIFFSLLFVGMQVEALRWPHYWRQSYVLVVVHFTSGKFKLCDIVSWNVYWIEVCK